MSILFIDGWTDVRNKYIQLSYKQKQKNQPIHGLNPQKLSTSKYKLEHCKFLIILPTLYGLFFYYFLYLLSSYFLLRRLCRLAIILKSVPTICSMRQKCRVSFGDHLRLVISWQDSFGGWLLHLGICSIRVVMVRASECWPSQDRLDSYSAALVIVLSDYFGMIFTINNQQFQCQQYSYFQSDLPLPILSSIAKGAGIIIYLWIRVRLVELVIIYFVGMKAKEFIVENKEKVVLGVLGVAVAGGLAYWLVRKFSSSKKQPTPTPVPFPNEPASKSSVSSDNSQKTSQQEGPTPMTYDQKFARIINETRSILDSQHGLTPEVIKAIIRGQYELANEDIKALIYGSRRDRRAKLDDALQYAKILTKFQINLEELQEKHLGSILSRFNIDKAEWKEACNTWEMNTREGDEGLSQLIRTEQEKQLLSLRIPNTKTKPYLFIEQILRFKIKTLEVLNPTELGIDLAADDAARYDMIETYINDLVFRKFNVEQEDIEYSIQQLGPREKEQVIKYEDDIGMLMEKFITDEDEEKESNFY